MTGTLSHKRGISMSTYIIGDLHLSFQENKPMSIFGGNWEGHSDKIKKDWEEKVNPDDTVILAGDFSWAMNLENTYLDFKFIEDLPGKKIMLKGNHDYWWSTVTKIKNFLEEKEIKNIDFLYNNSFLIEDKIIVGTRGWSLTDTDNGKKMIERESGRLELSIKDGIKKYNDDKEIICILHYPPITNLCLQDKSEFFRILKKYNIKKCFYGHLHGASHKDAIEGIVDGIDLKLISGDYLDFKLLKIIDNKGEIC